MNPYFTVLPKMEFLKEKNSRSLPSRLCMPYKEVKVSKGGREGKELFIPKLVKKSWPSVKRVENNVSFD